MLRELELVNFRSHENTSLTFSPDGRTLLSGGNGAGKTSVAKAIEYLFFDSVSSGPIGDLLREGASEGSVSALFDSPFHGKSYHLMRVFNRRGTVSWTLCDAEENEITHQPDEIRLFLEAAFGIPTGVKLSTLCSEVVIVPQGTFTAAFHQTPAARKAVFEPLLGVNEFAKYSDSLRGIALRPLEQERHAVELELARIESVVASIEPLLCELGNIDQDIVDEKREYQEWQTERASLQVRLGAYAQKLEAVQQGWTDLDRTRQTWEISKERLEAVRKQLEVYQAAQEGLAQNKQEHDEYEQNQKEIVLAETDKSALEHWGRDADRIGREIGDLDAQYGRLSEQIEEQDALIGELQQEQGARCPMCGAELDKEHRKTLLQKAQEKKQELEERSAKIAVKISTLATDFDEAFDGEKKYKAIEDHLSELHDRADGYFASYAAYERCKSIVDAGMDDNTAELQQAVADAENAHQAAQQTLEILQAAYDSQAHDTAIKEERELGTELAKAQVRIEELQRRKASKEKELEHAETQAVLAKNLEERLITLAKSETVLDRARASFKTLGPELAKTITGRVSAQAAIMYDELLGEHRGTLVWGSDYGITMMTPEGEERSFAKLSGGEQMMAALAVRDAALEELSSAGFVVLDEPTTNFDAIRCEVFASQISQALKRRGQQAIIVSHHGEFEQYCDEIIRLRNVNGVTEVDSDPD